MRKYKYFKLASVADEKRGWLWYLDQPLPQDYWLRYRRASMFGTWGKPYPLYTYQDTDYLYDKPDAVDSSVIVSDRAREVLEREVPSAFQYLPIRVSGPGSSTLPNYWIANWLPIIDCVIGDEYYAKLIGDSRVGLVKGDELMDIWRSDLVGKIKAAKLTGFRFYGIHVEYGDPPPRRKNKSK